MKPKFPLWIAVIMCSLLVSVISLMAINLSEKISKEGITLGQSTSKVSSNTDFFNVTKVVDGDTIEININGNEKKLRLIGINTPETVAPYTPVQCFGREASNKAKELLTNKRVRIERDDLADDYDKFGRMLRYAYLEDGTFFNEVMIKEGYAYEYTFEGRPYKYQKEFKIAQKDAEKNQKGLWNVNTCNGKK